MRKWDERERILRERPDRIQLAESMLPKFILLVQKYAKLKGIDLPSPDEDEDLEYYNFLNDASFIDFANDESGIIFNADMFTFETTDEEDEYDKKRFDLKAP